MARKSKLDQILETYTEEEIREICAASSSRTDFVKRLGMKGHHYDAYSQTIETLTEKLSLNTKHFINRNTPKYTKKEVEHAYNSSHNYLEIARKLGLDRYYKNENNQRRMVRKLLEKYNLPTDRIRYASRKRQIDALDEKIVRTNARIATSYKELAQLCGFERQGKNGLSKVGKAIAERYGIDHETFGRNKITETKEITSIASWLYHNNQVVCSKCKTLLKDEAFILSPMTTMKDEELVSSILCPNCHASMKQAANPNVIRTLTPISQENCKKHGIYLIRHRDTGMLYVGKTILTFEYRLNQHIAAARQNTGQAIERYMGEEGIGNFDFYILEEITSKDNPYVLKRENYWMSVLGSNNKLIGYNQYLSPIKSHISEDVVSAIIEDIKTLPASIEDIAQKHGVSASNVNRIKNGKIRYRETEQYPISSAYDQMKINDIRRCLSLLANTSDSVNEIAQNLQMSTATVLKYNRGQLPRKLSQYEGAFDDFSFPIRIMPEITKPGQSKIVEQTKKADKKKASLEDQKIIDDIFQVVLEHGYSEAAKQLGFIEQVLRRTLRRYGYPTNVRDLFAWLDEHPEKSSCYRVPSAEDLIEAINLYGVTKASQYFQVGDALFKTWCEYRSIVYEPKRAVCIYIQELDKQFDTCSNTVRYLWGQGYDLDPDMKRATAAILRAIERNGGHLLGLTFQRIEKPLAYKKEQTGI